MDGVPAPGTVVLDKYRVESELGRGGMGLVFLVTHLQLGEQLALKVLRREAAASPEVSARFLREAQSAVRLRGEHVTRVLDVGKLPGGLPFIAMEYLRGNDLAWELDRRKVLPVGETVDYVLQACDALAEAHALGIVHRDIKAANLFLTTRPEGTPMIKVLDFGVSKGPVATAPLVTQPDTVMGTPGYMAPEQMRAARDVDNRADIWALGIVLYECLNGRRPFDANAFSALMLKVGTEPPPPLDQHVPRPLQAAVLRCLEKERAARYPTVAALAAAIAPFASDQRTAAMIVDRTGLMMRRASGESEPVPVAPPPAPPTTLSSGAGTSRALPRSKHKLLGGAVVVVGLIGLLAVGSWAVVRRSPADAAGGAPRGSGVVSPSLIEMEDNSEAAGAEDARCAKLQTAQNWQDLAACAQKLEQFGAKAKADAYAEIAASEQQSQLAAPLVLQAIGNNDLKRAQAELSKIGSESAYYAAPHDAFDKAEAAALEAAVHKAQGYAAAHDCGDLRALQKQLAASSSTKVVEAVDAIKCSDGGGGSAKAECATLNVDDLLGLADFRYTSGHADTALELVTMALACRQSAPMYRVAALYACGAHNASKARSYFARVASASQAAVVQRCQQDGIDLRR